MELLLPAGDKESLSAAIYYGADAIYCSGKKFGARKFANNFSEAELIEAVNLAHKNNKKIYITINTLVKNEEILDLVNFVFLLNEISIDAVIIQDFGVFYLLKKYFSSIPIHFSTQTTIHNSYGTLIAEHIGGERVILSRELTINEIKEIKNKTKIDLEIFVAGALCYSYSGLCYFSSFIGGRSGNRGACAQPCRKKYNNEKYYFSLKDLFLEKNQIKKIKEIGIKSLKIEGRMKNYLYIAALADIYHKMLSDTIYDYDANEYKISFGRETSVGYLNEFHPKNIFQNNYPGNIGYFIGEIIFCKKNYVFLKTNYTLMVRDLIQIIDDDEIFKYQISEIFLADSNGVKKNKVFKIEKDNYCFLKFKQKINLPAKTKLFLINSQFFNEKYKLPKIKFIDKKNIKLNLSVKIEENFIFINTLINNRFDFTFKYATKTENSQKYILNSETFFDIFKKTGNTPFNEPIIKNFSNINSFFISLNELNNVRKKFYYDLEKKYKQALFNVKLFTIHSIKKKLMRKQTKIESNIEINVKIDKFEYINYLDLNLINKIYLPIEFLETQDLEYIKNKIIFYLPTIKREHELEKYNNLLNLSINNGYNNFLINNIGDLYFIKLFPEVNFFSDYNLYCINNFSIKFLKNMGIKNFTYNLEDDLKNLSSLPKNGELVIFSNPSLFISEACYEKKCTNSINFFTNNENDLFSDICVNCRKHIFPIKSFSLIGNLKELKKLGFRKFRIEFLNKNFTKDEIEKIILSYKNDLFIKNTTMWNYKRGLE